MEIDFEKMGGLVPAIIQDAVTKNVLMLGFMNKEAYDKTIETKIPVQSPDHPMAPKMAIIHDKYPIYPHHAASGQKKASAYPA